LTASENRFSSFLMISEVLQDRAAQYAAGAMAAPEREAFEILLEAQPELRELVEGLREVVTAVTLADARPVVAPPPALKARLLGELERLPPRPEPAGLVVTDARGRVEWVNPAFIAMCGHSLAELKGQKPGHVLQGPETDHAAVDRIRTALRTRQVCRETLVNYHKDGTKYRAEVRIAPILDDAGEPLWFVARERKLAEA